VLLYQRTLAPFKVYVKELYTPGGRQVLLDSPRDHVHHHALMYAIGAGDVDFWGEVPRNKPGKQNPRDKGTVKVMADADPPRAVIQQTIDWGRPGNPPLLEEQRSVTAYTPRAVGATLLTWSGRFVPAEGRKQVRLWGRHYFGLGLRVKHALDKGSFLNPTGEAGKHVRGSEKLVAAPWCAYRARMNGKPVTLAMFDHPKNPRHPATWFTMNTPFGYLSATLNLKEKPILLKNGKVLDLVYGVALWDGEPDSEAIGALYRRWLSVAPTPKPKLD
jgi:hypothetical protein